MSRPSSGVAYVLLAAQANELADRLREIPESRLGRAVDLGAGHETVAAAGLRIAQLLADLAAAADTPPIRRTVPDLGPFAVADQLAVTATDLAPDRFNEAEGSSAYALAQVVALLAVVAK